MNRSQSFRGLSPHRGTRRKLIIPAFSSTSPTWAGVSEITKRFSLSLPNDFSFKLPITQPNESFVAAVSWTSGLVTYRFKFSELGVLYYPVYNGERLNKDSYLEIWSVAGESTTYTDTEWVLETSGLVLPTIQTDITDNYETILAIAI